MENRSDRAKKLFLYPRPKEVIWGEGVCSVNAPVKRVLTSELGVQCYQIEIKSDEVLVRFGERAEHLAEACLEQLKIQSKSVLPVLDIRDWPDLENRGFMLDISRNRVPKRETLEKLVHVLWLFKYNQLQLYTEHTYAYKNHQQIWDGASPMTCEDYLWLDQLCHSKGIELVPNQNTFGHFERWLKHPSYHHLAECPNGFEHPLGGFREFGSVLKPNSESLELINELLTEFLPNFTSDQVNIGCDETWELGQGASRERVEQEGRYSVYLKHVETLINLVEKHKKIPQVWADILLSNKEPLPKSLKDRFIPMIWGYEADHPFDEQCEEIASQCTDFYVVPGTSCWNSFTSRWDNSAVNIKAACTAAKKYGASGMLLTSWGDNGHHYPYSMMLPSILLGASLSWGNEDDFKLPFNALKKFLQYTAEESEAIESLVTINRLIAPDPFNRSLSFDFLFLSEEKLLDSLEKFETVQIDEIKSYLNGMLKRLQASSNEMKSTHGQELEFSILAILDGLNRLDFYFKEASEGLKVSSKNSFVANWKETSREGGFSDSCAMLYDSN